MRRILATLAVVTLLFSAGSAWADFYEGVAAYERGDYDTAIQEWLPLAEQGNVTAQYNLGNAYAEGADPRRWEEFKERQVQAYMWWVIAMAKGNKDAAHNLDIITDDMSINQRVKALTLAKEWAEESQKQANQEIAKLKRDYKKRQEQRQAKYEREKENRRKELARTNRELAENYALERAKIIDDYNLSVRERRARLKEYEKKWARNDALNKLLGAVGTAATRLATSQVGQLKAYEKKWARNNDFDSLLGDVGNWTQAPDNTYVGGSTWTLAPDGTYVGGSTSTLAPDDTYVGGTAWTRAPDGTYVGNGK